MIVTAFYDIYDNPDKLKYYTALFHDICNSELPIVVFTDPSLMYLFGTVPDNVRICPVPLIEFELYSLAMAYKGELPAVRNHAKDTQKFLALMNTKIEFIMRAGGGRSDETYIWVDFGILKIIRDRPAFIHKLRIANGSKFDKITIPGYLSYGCPVDCDNVSWRFCGGILIVPSSSITLFFHKSKHMLTYLCTTQKLTWETNMWYFMELGGEHANIEWYFGSFNDSILRDFT